MSLFAIVLLISVFVCAAVLMVLTDHPWFGFFFLMSAGAINYSERSEK